MECVGGTTARWGRPARRPASGRRQSLVRRRRHHVRAKFKSTADVTARVIHRQRFIYMQVYYFKNIRKFIQFKFNNIG